MIIQDKQIDRMRKKSLALRDRLRAMKPEYFKDTETIEAEIMAISDLEKALKALD